MYRYLNIFEYLEMLNVNFKDIPRWPQVGPKKYKKSAIYAKL